eukprot:TRINITY_DN8326_c0_g1_i2.p1 TRINITY_DN8326_c0_g1~~TRINITY_DN8326_c0_g1_i2.p1  ORF type:complete len:294 (-),score=47.56 TRINITY_DN8326_c0_g1_i2:114-995(-)
MCIRDSSQRGRSASPSNQRRRQKKLLQFGGETLLHSPPGLSEDEQLRLAMRLSMESSTTTTTSTSPPSDGIMEVDGDKPEEKKSLTKNRNEDDTKTDNNMEMDTALDREYAAALLFEEQRIRRELQKKQTRLLKLARQQQRELARQNEVIAQMQAQPPVALQHFFGGMHHGQPVFSRHNRRHHGDNVDVDNMSYEQLLALGERIGSVNTKGLSDIAIDRNTASYSYTSSPTAADKKEKTENNSSCSICLMDFEDGEDVRLLPCTHLYHKACIDKWLVQNGSCAVCKATVIKRD